MIRRRRTLLAVALGALILSTIACDSAGAGKPITLSESDAYVAAIRWFAEAFPEPQSLGPDDTIVTKARVVYVAPTSGSPIPAGSQVAVVGNLADMGDNIELRFADVRDDAIDLDAEGEPVRDDGALLVVGKVPEKRPPVDVSVEVYFNSSTQHDYTLRISRRDGTYVVTQATENE